MENVFNWLRDVKISQLIMVELRFQILNKKILQ